MSIELIAVLMFSSMVLLLLTGRQIFLIIGGIGVLFSFLWGGYSLSLPFSAGYSIAMWYPILAVAPFIFMGLMLAKSGVAANLFHALYLWLGHIKGGLAMSDVGLSCLVSAMSGTNIASTVTSTTISLPHMLKHKYNKSLVLGVILAGGSLGFLIPPSIVFILYGVIAGVSIGHLWLAGAIPGFILAMIYVIYIAVRCHFNPQLGPPLPPDERVSWGRKFRAIMGGMPAVILIFVVLGLLFMGVTSLIESSAIGAVGAVVCAALNRKLTGKILLEVADQTLQVTSMALWIFVAAILFGAVFAGLGATHAVENILSIAGGGRWAIMLMMQLSFFGLGMVMDDTAMLLIVAPVYIPIVAKLGFSLVWFGVLYVLNCQMAFLTPPFGYNLFLMKGILPMVVPDSGITLTDIYRSTIPFVAMQAMCLGIVMVFPQIALFLPKLIFGG